MKKTVIFLTSLVIILFGVSNFLGTVDALGDGMREGGRCKIDSQCSSGLECSPESNRCTNVGASSCEDYGYGSGYGCGYGSGYGYGCDIWGHGYGYGCGSGYGCECDPCGNGVIGEDEECDDGNTEDGDGCSSTCKEEEVEPICGNGITEEGETCDGEADCSDECAIIGCDQVNVKGVKLYASTALLDPVLGDLKPSTIDDLQCMVYIDRLDTSSDKITVEYDIRTPAFKGLKSGEKVYSPDDSYWIFSYDQGWVWNAYTKEGQKVNFLVQGEYPPENTQKRSLIKATNANNLCRLGIGEGGICRTGISHSLTQIGKTIECNVKVKYEEKVCYEKKETLEIPSCPPDTICTKGWQEGVKNTEGIGAGFNTHYNSSCDVFEVCNSDMDKYVNEAEGWCAPNKDRDKYKFCLAKNIIYSLGPGAEWMKGYFAQELSCIYDTSYCKETDSGKCLCSNKKHSANNNKFSKCTPGLGFSNQAWKTDTDWSTKNDCVLNDLPAHASINKVKTGTCTDYSIVLTTLLRKAGYSKNEVYSIMGNDPNRGGHVYNLVKFPGVKKFRIIDTNGNLPNPDYFTSKTTPENIPKNIIPYDYCKFTTWKGVQNDAVVERITDEILEGGIDGC
jgi:cysteine-rich repeat protein